MGSGQKEALTQLAGVSEFFSLADQGVLSVGVCSGLSRMGW